MTDSTSVPDRTGFTMAVLAFVAGLVVGGSWLGEARENREIAEAEQSGYTKGFGDAYCWLEHDLGRPDFTNEEVWSEELKCRSEAFEAQLRFEEKRSGEGETQ